MSQSANVKSLEAMREFHVAVLKFHEEARLCLTSLENQLLKVLGWLERDRPGFWKREIELCYRQHGEARVSYHKCRMRKMGDFKPTCFEERKAMEAAKKALEFAQKQIPVVKQWTAVAHQEANEFKGRSAQLHQFLERDLPELLALLAGSVRQLEDYANIQTAQRSLLTNGTVPNPAEAQAGQPAESNSSAASDDEGDNP